MKKDPICRMEVREEEAVTAECDGVLYYFCSEGCRDKFLREKTCARNAYDLIIIGGGPAGLTAAVYAATRKMEALLAAKDLDGEAVDRTKIENYLGFHFMFGPNLTDKFNHHLLPSHYIDRVLSGKGRLADLSWLSGCPICRRRDLNWIDHQEDGGRRHPGPERKRSVHRWRFGA